MLILARGVVFFYFLSLACALMLLSSLVYMCWGFPLYLTRWSTFLLILGLNLDFFSCTVLSLALSLSLSLSRVILLWRTVTVDFACFFGIGIVNFRRLLIVAIPFMPFTPLSLQKSQG